MYPSQWSCQMRRVWNSSFVVRTESGSVPSVRFCETLPPSPTLFFRVIVASHSSYVFHKEMRTKIHVCTDSFSVHYTCTYWQFGQFQYTPHWESYYSRLPDEGVTEEIKRQTCSKHCFAPHRHKVLMRGILDQFVSYSPIGLLPWTRNGDVVVYLDNFTFPLVIWHNSFEWHTDCLLFSLFLLFVTIVNFLSHRERKLTFSGLSSFVLSMLQTADSHLCLPLPVTWQVMWHLTAKVLNLYVLTKKRHLDGTVVWSIYMSSSCKPLLSIISAVFRQVFRQIKFSDIFFEEGWMCDIPCFRGDCEEEGTQNLKWIKQILNELYFPHLRQLRQMTWGLTSTDVRLTSQVRETHRVLGQGDTRFLFC